MTKLLIPTLALALLASSCSTTGGSKDAAVLLSAGVTYYSAKAAQKSPEKAEKLRAAADALDVLAEGIVNRDTILALLTEKLGKKDPELAVLVTLVVGYFAPAETSIPEAEKYSALAKSVAAAIRAGLPAA